MLRFLTAGESHGPCLIAIVEGMPSGLPLTRDNIDRDLCRRQGGYGRSGRMEIERDEVEILSGITECRTTGAPIALRIENASRSSSGDRLSVPRPGHADLAGAIKYRLDDLRVVAERASARETAARVGAGAIAKRFLLEFGVVVGSYVAEIGGVVADIPDLPFAQLWELAEASDVRCPVPRAAEAMRRRMDEVRAAGDSAGGVFVVAATGVPVGLGSYVHWDRRLDGCLAQAVMSIPAVKGLEIGPAFENARLPGTQVQDEVFPKVPQGHSPTAGLSVSSDPSSLSALPLRRTGFVRRTNRAGGIEGGISNGEPIVVRAAMKPIPTTVTPLRSVDLASGEPTVTEYVRSDVCAVPAAAVVGEAMVAWVLADALLEKLGGDSIEEIRARWK
jgi:chorismate synthase